MSSCSIKCSDLRSHWNPFSETTAATSWKPFSETVATEQATYNDRNNEIDCTATFQSEERFEGWFWKLLSSHFAFWIFTNVTQIKCFLRATGNRRFSPNKSFPSSKRRYSRFQKPMVFQTLNVRVFRWKTLSTLIWGSFEGIPVFQGISGCWAGTHTTVPTLWQ